MASGKIKKILVHIKNSNQVAVEASFNSCIFNQLGISDPEILECKVNCDLQQNKLILQICDSQDHRNDCFTVRHPSICPLMEMSEEERSSLPDEVLRRGIDVGVAVVLEASDEKILLTRRAQHMRTFAGGWVPPGGHIELNESLEEAGLRELMEETGLVISPSDKESSSILALWESVFPPIFYFGPPSRHHVVIYWHILTNKTSNDLQSEIKLNPDEVDACFWLPSNLTDTVVNGIPFLLDDIKKLQYISLNENGEQVQSSLDPGVLTKKLQPDDNKDAERITTGTQYAIEMWSLKNSLKKRNETTKSNL